MADRREETREEFSSSQERREVAMVLEAGESSRPPQIVPPPVMPIPQGSRVDEDATLRAQLRAAMSIFSQVMQNPRFMDILQPTQPIGATEIVQEHVEVQTPSVHPAESMETARQLAGSKKRARMLPSVHEQVAETPVTQAFTVQPAILQQPLVGQFGQGSRFQGPPQVFAPPTLHPGYFGGGSVFQSMIGHAPGTKMFQHGTVLGGAQSFMPNPMYGNIGMPPGFQGVQSSFGMPRGSFGMAGFPNQQPPLVHSSPVFSGPAGFMLPSNVPMMQALPLDQLMAFEKPKPYKEGVAAVQFDTFRGFEDRTKALSFIQHFDAAFVGGNFTEASKVRKAATFLKGNASQ